MSSHIEWLLIGTDKPNLVSFVRLDFVHARGKAREIHVLVSMTGNPELSTQNRSS